MASNSRSGSTPTKKTTSFGVSVAKQKDNLTSILWEFGRRLSVEKQALCTAMLVDGWILGYLSA